MSGESAGVLIIVGGASGIGGSLVGLAAAAGWRVCVVDRVPEPPTSLADQWLEADARDRNAMRRAVGEISLAWGSVDAVVITAGVTDPAPISSITDARVQEIMDVNVTSAIMTMSSMAPLLGDHSAVVLVSSVAAHRGGGYFGASTYAASKCALEGLARGLARELAPRGIRVNCIAPGPTSTPMLMGASPEVIERVRRATLLDRVAEPSEIAAVALFLIGPAASYMTGAVVAVDGGASLK